MTVESNKRLAREAIQIWTTGDLGAADELYASDYVNHQHHDPNDPRDLHGLEAMKAFAAEFRQAFPDFHDSIDIQIAEGEMVATRFTSRGTHRGAFMGVEPTNKELSWLIAWEIHCIISILRYRVGTACQSRGGRGCPTGASSQAH